MRYKVKILDVEKITHDVKRFRIEKPLDFSFKEGQAVEFNVDGFISPFTIVSTQEDPYLEFMIKIYVNRNGITKRLNELKESDEIIITKSFGTISYMGKGTFIAGGAGITPFISIFRDLEKKKNLNGNSLFFSNKTREDIIIKDELDSYSDLDKTYLLDSEGRRINEEFLKANVKKLDQYFYICGPIGMVGEITTTLIRLGADPEKVVIEL